MPASAPIVSVVIPTLDTWDLTRAAVTSVAHAGAPSCEIIVVDDGGRTHPPEDLGPVSLVRRETRGGFSRACNDGMRQARGSLVVLLNSDATLRPGALDAAHRAFESAPQLGIVGATLFYPDGTPQWSGGPEPTARWLFVLATDLARRRPRTSPRGHRPAAVTWVSGAAMALRRSMLEQIGLFAEDFEFYGQDVDICLRARAAGWEVRLEPTMQVDHHLGATIAEHPERLAMLWSDLVQVVRRHRGPSAASRAAWALSAGAWIQAALPRRRHDSPLPAAALHAAARRARRASRLSSATIARLSEDQCP